MSEETWKPEAQLSDAELAEVSGAYDKTSIGARARAICDSCIISGGHCGGKRFDSIYAYLLENGPYSVKYYGECPYYTP